MPTLTGALGDANGNGGPAARVSYTASYYDDADRDVADVNVGTNGGAAWTRPSTVPADSASTLVTAYTYDAAGNLAFVTDPNNEMTAYTYDAAGRLVQQVADYTDGVPTDSSNQTTDYTYDGDDNLTSETAVMPQGEASQTTDYVYGVSTGPGGTGSAIDDNDLLYQVQYPDPTTGNASSAQGETYSYDALGDTLTYTDRNGTTHAYSRDGLDRLTSDSITHFGAGVDSTVASIGYSYNDAGDLQDATSYDAGAFPTII